MTKPQTVDFKEMMKELKESKTFNVLQQYHTTDLGFEGVQIRSFFFNNRAIRVKNQEDTQC